MTDAQHLATAVSAPVNRATPLPEHALEVHEITKRFTTAEGVVTALDHLSLRVAPGEFLSVIGPSGCGKSTLFNIIGGLVGDYEGRVTVGGETISGTHAAIGMVF